MNTFKLYRYMQELTEVFIIVMYCLFEYVTIAAFGIFITGFVVYFAIYYEIANEAFVQILYACATVFIFILYALLTKVFKRALKCIKYSTAVYFSMIGQLFIVQPIMEFYYGDDIQSIFGIMAYIGILLTYFYFYKYCYKESRRMMWEVM